MRVGTIVSIFPIVSGEVYHVAPHGDDNSEATLTSPLATLQACVDRLNVPGDECRLASGTYSGETISISGLEGTESAPIVIGGDPDGEVLHDGTAPVPGKGWQSAGSGVWKTQLPEGTEVSQLWVDGEMMTPARWPNALWSDKSVFEWERWSKFDRKAAWGPFPANTPDPITFTDVGNLGKSGVDVTGAMFIGNIAHMDTFVGTVTKHSKSSNAFDVQLHVNTMGNTKVGNSIYFLEGLPAFIDQPEEWAFDVSSRTLWLHTKDGKTPSGHDVKHKVQTYALNITNSKNLHVKDMKFFGTTLNANGGIPNLSLENLHFQYPSFSKRMLGDYRTASPTVIADKGSSFSVFNCSWYGADSLTMRYVGGHPVFRNNLWEYNDWTGTDSNGHTGLGGWVLDASGGGYDLFERNSMLNNGPSVAYTCGKGSTVRLNRMVGEADLQNDGALIQVRSGAATDTTVAQNWLYNSAKGLRLDSGSNTEVVPSEKNNTISQNIAMYTNGMMLKNDNNFYTGNLALWPPNFDVHGSKPSAVFRVDTSRSADENQHSVVEGNVANSWTQKRGVTRSGHENVYDANVHAQLRDPENLDFRPRKGSTVDKLKAGPYPLADGSEYWIPGRMEWRASVPVPPHGTKTAKADLDLMFLAAYGCDQHSVYFGSKPNKLSLLGTLAHGANVQAPGKLTVGGTYYWRVDAKQSNGKIIPGDVWQFTVAATDVVLV